MSKDTTAVLKEATKDLLSPESLAAIEEAVNVKADEKAKLQVEAALVAQDDKHAEMLTKLMEQMDVNYTSKLEKLIKRLDESYTNKLLKVKGHYEAKLGTLNEQLTVKAQETVDALGGRIDTFLESRMNDLLPADQLNEAVKNRSAFKILEQIRQIVSINEASVNESVKEAFIDGKKQIDEAKAEAQRVLTENTQLKAKLVAKEAEILLEQKTAKLPSAKREQVKKSLAGKDAAFITENFQYVCEMFDTTETIEAKKVKDTTPVVGKVDAPVIVESVKSTVDPQMQGYLNNLK